MRTALFPVLVGLVAACTPPEHLQPASGFGDGATGYATGYGAPPPAAAAPVPGGIPSSEINSALFGTASAPAGTAAAPAAAPALNAPAAVAAAPAPGAVPAAGTLGISDEQDFSAVSSRETIETDKARIEANKAQYTVIAPTALPEREGESVSVVVEYVLSAPNGLGQVMYDRPATKAEATQKACARYPTDEKAQEAFLKSGGPKRDPKKLDPDGDGYACGFDPTPFRQAAGN